MLDLLDAFGTVDLARSATDIVAGRVRITLGSVTYTLPVRSIGANEDWIAGLDANLKGLLNGLTSEAEERLPDTSQMLMALIGAAPVMLDALISFDHTNVLPARDQLRANVTELEIVRATAEVWLAANPTLAIAMAKIQRTIAAQVSASLQPTSSSLPITAGPSKKSDQTSPTSSSSPISMRRPAGASRRSGRRSKP